MFGTPVYLRLHATHFESTILSVGSLFTTAIVENYLFIEYTKKNNAKIANAVHSLTVKSSLSLELVIAIAIVINRRLRDGDGDGSANLLGDRSHPKCPTSRLASRH